MKLISAFISLLFVTSIFSQDTVWHKVHVNDDITLNLPGQVNIIDTVIVKGGKVGRFRFFKTESKNSVLGLTITPNETNINVEDKESFTTVLKEMAEGACKGATNMGFICATNDTVIDRLASKRVMFFQHDAVNPMMVNFFFLLNDRIYTITQAPVTDDMEALPEELNTLLASVHFNHTNIKEQKFESK